jgi:hypothetical protein
MKVMELRSMMAIENRGRKYHIILDIYEMNRIYFFRSSVCTLPLLRYTYILNDRKKSSSVNVT